MRRAVMIASLIGMTLGCGASTKILVKQDSYTPAVATSLAAWKGKEIFLASFENQAEDTSIYYYYSTDRKMAYEGAPSIHSYLWYCAEKALVAAGAKVYPDAAPTGVPELQLTILSWSEERFRANVMLLKKGAVVFEKEFLVELGRPDTKDPTQLESRAYRNMDTIIQTLFTDPGLVSAFLEK